MRGRGSSNQAFDDALKAQLRRWRDDRDEVAHRAAYESLSKSLFAPQFVVEALGNGAIEEVRQEILIRLLGRSLEELCTKTSAVAFAKAIFRNQLLDELKKWRVRQQPGLEDPDQIEQEFHRLPSDSTHRLDAARALRLVESLEGKGRLAVLLTTRPDRISQLDWQTAVAGHPPPPPPRPTHPLDAEDASLLMYPPKAVPETAEARQRRLDTFGKLYRRTLAWIRNEMESSS